MTIKKLKSLGYERDYDMCKWAYPYKWSKRFDKYGTCIGKCLNPTNEYRRTYTDRMLINDI